MSVLPDDQMNSVINCLIAKSTWDDMILYHEVPFDVKESRVIDLKLCYNTFKFKEGLTLTQTFTRYKVLMNELVNDGIKLSKLKINIGFINGLPKKWLSFCQSLKNTNHVKDSELASLFDDNEMVEVKVLMALAEENNAVSKEGVRNGERVKISMRKIYTLLEMEENNDRKVCLDYLCIDLNYVEEQRGVDQLTEDPSNLGLKDLVFVKSSADDTKVIIPGVERTWLSEAEDFILPKNDTADESSVCSIPLPPLKKLDGTEPISGPKTIKSILRSKSTFKAVPQLLLRHLKSLGRMSSRPNMPRPSKRFFSPCIHCGGIDHLSNECLYYPICKLCGSYDHDTNGHNMIISLERKINPRNPQHAFKKCEACGSSNHTTTDHYNIEWFKRGEALQAKKAEALKSTRAESSNDNRKPIWYLDSGCSRHMTGVKSYLHKYMEQRGCKVVFGDDSTCTTEGYGSIKCNGTIFNSNKEIVMIAPRSLNTRRQQTEETYHITFDESPKAIKFSKSAVDNINITKTKRYPPDEYLHPYEPSQRSLNTYPLQVEDTSVHNTIPIPILPLPIPSMVTLAPQDRWSKDKHIELVNIIGFESSTFPNHVCKLDKAIYGLKQAPRAWYETLLTFLIEHKFVRGKIDNTLFIYKTQTGVILVQIYVDDIIFGSTSTKLYKQFANLTNQIYEMSMMGVLTYFFGFHIKQSERSILINQEKYVKDLLKKYDINGSSVKTPMVPPNNLGPDLNGKSVNETQYIGMIGSLIYLTASRPDIQFSTYLCAKYQANPKECHLTAVKRIFKYLKGTPSLGLWYPKCLGFDLKGYSDSDYARCNMNKKSTSAEAEYVVATGCCANILWMKSQLTDYDIIYKKVSIFCDNTSVIAISNNPVMHSRTKHIDIKYHFVRDHVLKGDIKLHFIPTQYQLADIFTKPLEESTFKRLIVEPGMLNIDSKPEASTSLEEN
nr:retrovirus-related Pol polyprotein from transposon TNT 1-94 [Tanacetum cinerariifolium]